MQGAGAGAEPEFQLEFKEMTRTVLTNVLGSDLMENVLMPVPSVYDGKTVVGIHLPLLDGQGAFLGVASVDAIIS